MITYNFEFYNKEKKAYINAVKLKTRFEKTFNLHSNFTLCLKCVVSQSVLNYVDFSYGKVYTKDVIEKIVFSSFNYTYIIIGLALWASPIGF